VRQLRGSTEEPTGGVYADIRRGSATREYEVDNVLLGAALTHVISPSYPLVHPSGNTVDLQKLSLPPLGHGKAGGDDEGVAAVGRRSLMHTMELGSTEAIKKAVAANLGISIVSSRAVTLEVMIGSLCAVRISDLDLRHSIFILYLRDNPLSSAVEGFRRFLSDRPFKGERAADIPALQANRTGKKRSRRKD